MKANTWKGKTKMFSIFLTALLGFAIGTAVSLSLGVVAPLVGVLFALVFVRFLQRGREHRQGSAREKKRLRRRAIIVDGVGDDGLIECPFRNHEPIFDRWDMEKTFTN